MFKKWKWLILIIAFIFPAQVIANTLTDSEPDTKISEEMEKRTSKMLRYQSSQYTQPEEENASFDVDRTLQGYDLVAENEQLALYVEQASLAIKVKNKETGYIWNSGLEKGKEYNLNKMWTNMAHSAMTIDYIGEDNKASSESILTNQSKVTLTKKENGFQATVDFKEAGISIQLNVSLNGDSLNISVPHNGIVEKENRLATLRLYPFLGAVEGTDQNGYLFIPDGSGALMRFSEKQLASMSPYRAAVYGEDKGFKRSEDKKEEDRVTPPHQVTMPVFGVTNGVGQNAFLTIIDGGKSYADILAYPSGVATDFHWVTAQYNYRYQYYQPTSQDMSGFNVYQEDMNEFDINQSITFLSKDEADYVGMAHMYQDYLVDRNMLKKHEDPADIRLEFLGGEVKDGLLFDSVHVMTPISDIPGYVKELNREDVEDVHVVYRGWSEGGLTGTLPEKFPIEEKLGSDNDFKQVHEFLKEHDIPLYYYTDYTKAYEGASGYSGRTDVARKINAETMAGKDGEFNYYYLSPKKSLEIAANDVNQYSENNINNLAVDTTGQVLFSDFNLNTMRPESISVYKEMFDVLKEEVNSIALYRPNDYMLPVTDRYLDIPMYSSNYIFVTDTVPFLQIVLKGYIPYYASFSNFQSNPEDEILRMIEYGAYPSFYLTSKPSHHLMYTPSADLYTSQFSDWKGEIVDQYKKMKQTLGQVTGETITFREVHETGVVEVGYSNGTSIVVNYTSEDVNVNGTDVKANGFKVLDRGTQS